MSITILTTMLIARVYGREAFGAFSIMQGIPALFFVIVDFGINAIATRELSKDFTRAQDYLGNIIAIRFLLSMSVILLVGLSLYVFPYSPELKFGIYLSLFLILTQALFATTNIIFQTKLRYDLSAIGYILGSFVVLGLVLATTYAQASIVWVNFSYVLGGVVTFLINFYFLARLFNLHVAFNFDPVIWRYLFAQSWPLGLMFVFSQINFKADALMLSVMPVPKTLNLNSTEAVAVYGLPYKVFEVALVVPTFFMNAVYPIFVRHMQESKAKLKQTFTKTTLVLFGAGVVAALVGVLLAPLAITILGGAEFAQSTQVLRLLIIGLPIFYITQPFAWLIVTLGKQKYLPVIYLISACLSFSANFILIPRFSFYASSIITWTSEFVILVLLVAFAHRAWKQHYAKIS